MKRYVALVGTAALALAAAGCSTQPAMPTGSTEPSANSASEIPAMAMPMAVTEDTSTDVAPTMAAEADGPPDAKAMPPALD